MEKDEYEDIRINLIDNNLNEIDFDFTEKTSYPTEGTGSLSGIITVKYKPTNIEKTYKKFNGSWTVDFENDLKGNGFKTKS